MSWINILRNTFNNTIHLRPPEVQEKTIHQIF